MRLDWLEIARQLFLYQPDSPLIFPTLTFWVWLLLIMAVHGLFMQRGHRAAALWTLLGFSIFFYYKSTGSFVLVFLGTLLVSHFTTSLLYRARRPAWKKFWLTLSLVFPLALLAYYKYTNFLLESVGSLLGYKPDVLDIFLPVGISFYTFHMISYAVDLYRGHAPVANFRDYALYISFFPHIVAGPIVRAAHILPQFRSFTLPQDERIVASGLWLIIQGLIKKVLIADYIAQYNDLIFAQPASYSGFENLMAIYGYGLQIFCDFSGYSDIAIGIARMMGFDFGVNFDKPYRSVSLTQFWRRWHISLSSWLRDYLYIPLGGNRKGTWRTYLNLFLTMLIGGLWHGASWRFVAWGGLHGLGLALERLVGIRGDAVPKVLWRRALGWLLTFHEVLALWVFFRAKDFSSALAVFAQLGSLDAAYVVPFIQARPYFLVAMGLGYFLHFLPMSRILQVEDLFVRLPWVVRLVVFMVCVQLILQMRHAYVQPFIYFQF